jgi:hypothetical protein
MLITSEVAMKIVSIILGFGLASIFRKVCNAEHCRIVKGPNVNTIQNQMYKIDEKCYKYNPEATLCDS